MIKADLILPDALIIGPMRTGTTWIYKYLQSRGDICLPAGVKETFYFDRRFNNKSVRWYSSHFKHFHPEKHFRVVEVAPSYFHSKIAPKRIQSVLGTPYIIAIVRNPVDRALSHYQHLRRYGLVTGSLREAIKQFPEIVNASLYARGLLQWESIFGPGMIALLSYEEMANQPEKFIEKLSRVLYLPYKSVPERLLHSKVNSAGEPPFVKLAQIGQKVADWLRNNRLYTPIKLAKILGLKSLFFGSGNIDRKNQIFPEDREFIKNLVEEDWLIFKQRFANRFNVE